MFLRLKAGWSWLSPAPLVLLLATASGAEGVLVELRVVDTASRDLHARVHVKDASGAYFPGFPDSTLFGHQNWPWMGGYFYYQAEPVTMNLAPGPAAIEVGKGMEWVPVRIWPDIQQDTTIVVVLEKAFDMAAESWFSGDTHVHASHSPVDYPVPPEAAWRIAQAEDLNMMWLLDGQCNFTGAPHPVSTDETILYYSFEYRNQACGHVELLGAKNPLSYGCCTPPAPANPFLSAYREDWAPHWDEALILAHPETGADFFMDEGWPGWGLGREFAVMATSGNLEGYAIASYSNAGDLALDRWHDALSCGYMIPPTGGTDAVCCRYWSRPPGAYRVYVKEEAVHNASDWVADFKGGEVFVTNYPLIPIFTVDRVRAGRTLDVPGPGGGVRIEYRIDSVLPVTTLEVIRNGEIAATIALPIGGGRRTWSGAHILPVERSGWIALRVSGTTDRRHAVSPDLFAQTGPVMIRMDGARPVNSGAAGRLYDQVDSLEMFVEMRGGWQNAGQREEALARIQAARDSLSRHFLQPPAPFQLLTPADEETLYLGPPLLLDWSDALDPEPGDRIRYEVSLGRVEGFRESILSFMVDTSEAVLGEGSLEAGRQYWWSVTAVDRGGNATRGTPAEARFFYSGIASGVTEPDETDSAGGDENSGDGQDGDPRYAPGGSEPGDPFHGSRNGIDGLTLSARPNPCSGRVWLQADVSGAHRAVDLPDGRVDVFDLTGRCLRSLALPSSGILWDGRDQSGRDLPSGAYWLRLAQTEPAAAKDAALSMMSMAPGSRPPAVVRLQVVR